MNISEDRKTLRNLLARANELVYQVLYALRKLIFRITHRKLILKSIDEIYEYTGETRSEVRKRFFDLATTKKAWEAANPRTDEEISRFYSETNAYIYADQRWNAVDPSKFNSRFKLLDFCRKNKVRTVLDYGAGVGEYCVFLAEQGFDVTYLEFYGKTWQFADWRFKQRGLKVKMLPVGEDFPAAYDLIVCAAVLEQVKEPVLVAQKLFDALNPNGYLCATFNFKYAGCLGLPENRKYANNFLAILDEMGLQLLFKDYFSFFQKRSHGNSETVK